MVLVCFGMIALGVAYVGTGLLEGVLVTAGADELTAEDLEIFRRNLVDLADPATNADIAPTPSSGQSGGLPGASTDESSVPAPPASITVTVPSGPATPQGRAFTAGPVSSVASDVIRRANDERVAAGLSRLDLDPVLQAEAEGWAERMTREGYVHSSQERLIDISRASSGGPVAENLHAPEVQCAAAMRCDLPEAHPTSGVLHVDWMRSSAHRSTLLDPAWDRVGVGVYCDVAGRMWAVALFSAPAGTVVDGDDVVPYREPKASGNDGVTCDGSVRGESPEWKHTPIS